MVKKLITEKEFLLAIIFFFLYILFNNAIFLTILDHLGAYWTFVIYYVIVYLTIFILSRFKFVILDTSIKKPLQVIGLSLVFFAFFAIFNWENLYIQYVNRGNIEGASSVFYGSEDGITWSFWYNLIHNISITWWLVGLSIFLISLLGLYLTSEKIKF